MSRFGALTGVLCLAVAVAIFVLTDGARRWYAGGFFAILGLVMLINAGRGRSGK